MPVSPISSLLAKAFGPIDWFILQRASDNPKCRTRKSGSRVVPSLRPSFRHAAQFLLASVGRSLTTKSRFATRLPLVTLSPPLRSFVQRGRPDRIGPEI